MAISMFRFIMKLVKQIRLWRAATLCVRVCVCVRISNITVKLCFQVSSYINNTYSSAV